MKFTLVTFVALVGAASAISVGRRFNGQCINQGRVCVTNDSQYTTPCCDDLLCVPLGNGETNVCLPVPSSDDQAKAAEAEELSNRSNEPAPPQARDLPHLVNEQFQYQCIISGECIPFANDPRRVPCCAGRVCKLLEDPRFAPFYACQFKRSSHGQAKAAEAEELSNRSDEPAPLQARDLPQLANDQPRRG